MTDKERDEIIKDAQAAINHADWVNKTAEKILPLLEADLKGEIDLDEELTREQPYFAVRLNQQEQVWLCIKLSDKNCPDCRLNKMCNFYNSKKERI